MLPASAVPVIVSVASFEQPLSATVPVTGSTSSVTDGDRRRRRRRGVDGHVERGRGGALVAGRVGCLGGEGMAPVLSAAVVIEELPPVAVSVPSIVVPSVS